MKELEGEYLEETKERRGEENDVILFQLKYICKKT